MKPLLSKTRLDKIARTLYGRNILAVFYTITPADGEVEIWRLTRGFNIIRERTRGTDVDVMGVGVRLWLAADADIDRSKLNVGVAVALTINGQTLRYTIDSLLPMEQLGAGYI